MESDPAAAAIVRLEKLLTNLDALRRAEGAGGPTPDDLVYARRLLEDLATLIPRSSPPPSPPPSPAR